MSKDWTVVQHTGQRIDLERDGQCKELKAPKDAQKLEVFRDLRPGQSVDDATITHFLTDK